MMKQPATIPSFFRLTVEYQLEVHLITSPTDLEIKEKLSWNMKPRKKLDYAWEKDYNIKRILRFENFRQKCFE